MQMTQIYNEHLTVFLFKVFLIEYFKKKCFWENKKLNISLGNIINDFLTF